MITVKQLYDATLQGEGIIAKHAKLNPDMPVFLLIAQDCHASELVDKWAIWASSAVPQSGGRAMADKIGEAKMIAELMRHWPLHKNPD